MAATSGKQLSVGLRFVTAFELNTNGRPKGASATTPYEGAQFSGAKAFTLTIPEPRKITHTGDDRVLAVDYLPPTDAPSAELRVSVNDYAAIALLTGINVGTVGEAKEIAFTTSKQGFEPQVGLMLYQQSLDSVTRIRRWRSIVIPKAICIPRPGGMSENPDEMLFSVAPQIVSSRLWGLSLVLATDAYTDAAVFEYMTEFKPHLAVWKGNNTATDFTFSTDFQAADTGKIAVFNNGVAITTNITKLVSKVTFTTAPATNDDVDIFYEVA